jgi:hypothetical protein
MMGKNFDGDNVTTLPNGAGYLYIRQAFFQVLDFIDTLAPHIILSGHIKDKVVDDKGEMVMSANIDLTGKIKSLICANADAIGYMYRKGNKTILSFKTSEEAQVHPGTRRIPTQPRVRRRRNEPTHELKVFYLKFINYNVISKTTYRINIPDLTYYLETGEMHYYKIPGIRVDFNEINTYKFAVSFIDNKMVKISLEENEFKNPSLVSETILKIYNIIRAVDKSVIEPRINQDWFDNQYQVYSQYQYLCNNKHKYIKGSCDICYEDDVELENAGCCAYQTCIVCKIELLKHNKTKCSFCNQHNNLLFTNENK